MGDLSFLGFTGNNIGEKAGFKGNGIFSYSGGFSNAMASTKGLAEFNSSDCAYNVMIFFFLIFIYFSFVFFIIFLFKKFRVKINKDEYISDYYKKYIEVDFQDDNEYLFIYFKRSFSMKLSRIVIILSILFGIFQFYNFFDIYIKNQCFA